MLIIYWTHAFGEDEVSALFTSLTIWEYLHSVATELSTSILFKFKWIKDY